MSTQPLLELENLSTHYVSAQGTRVVRAVDEVSLRINAGETLGIVGESGAGKSTLALTILRLLPPAARIAGGKLLFEGEDLLQKSEVEMRRVRGKRIAMILQDPMASLNPLFTIGDQVAEPIRVHEGAGRAAAWSRACELLKAVRIPSPQTRLRQHPHEMSGGMRQRIVGAISDRTHIGAFRHILQNHSIFPFKDTIDCELAVVLERRVNLREGRHARILVF